MDNMTLTLTKDEQTALIQLLDGASKFYGVQSAKAVAHFVDKLEQASKEATKEDTPNG